MPSRRSPRRRSRRYADALREIIGVALDMEEPLTDLAHLLCALRLMGYGLQIEDEYGAAIVAVAREAAGRLEAARGRWDQLVKRARKDLVDR